MRPIADRTAELARLHLWLFGAVTAPPAELPAYMTGDGALQLDIDARDLPRSVENITDEELINRAISAKNGHKVARLWAGDFHDHGSHSEADLALCCHLAFWTQRDAIRIDSFFRRSGLMRDKWNARRGHTTYGAQTIARAIAQSADVYQPPVDIPSVPLEPGFAEIEIDVETATLENL